LVYICSYVNGMYVTELLLCSSFDRIHVEDKETKT
jgi:hypothetical protein